MRRRAISRALSFALVAMAAEASIAQCPDYHKPTVTGTITSPAITEASGIAASSLNTGVLWIHNDSGGSNTIYALALDGALIGAYTLSGATAIDWEDMAIGSGPAAGVQYLYVGDIGDNFNIRPFIRVYRVAEPIVASGSPGTTTLGGVETITLAYPDGPRDAETLMIDVNGDIYIVSKRVTTQGRVYRAAFPQASSGTTVMEFVGEIPWGAVNGSGGATGGDISRDGKAIIVRRLSSYSPAATLWRREAGSSIAQTLASPGCDYALPASPQGEAIAFAPDDLSLFVLSEGVNQPIHYLAQVHAPGDVNGDELVNVQDLLAVINAWGRCQPPPIACHADFNRDGDVNVADLLTVIGHWG